MERTKLTDKLKIRLEKFTETFGPKQMSDDAAIGVLSVAKLLPLEKFRAEYRPIGYTKIGIQDFIRHLLIQKNVEV